MNRDERSRMLTKGLNRREFFNVSMGAAAIALGPGPVAAQGQISDTPLGAKADKFSRIFKNLPPFAEPSSALEHALLTLGAPGGPMDGRQGSVGCGSS